MWKGTSPEQHQLSAAQQQIDKNVERGVWIPFPQRRFWKGPTTVVPYIVDYTLTTLRGTLKPSQLPQLRTWESKVTNCKLYSFNITVIMNEKLYEYYINVCMEKKLNYSYA